MKRLIWYGALALAVSAHLGAQDPALNPTPQNPGAPQNPAVQRPEGASPAAKRPPQTVMPQTYPADQVAAGQRTFSAQCGFCHGRDAAGGESGPDLTRSTLVAEDVRGDRIGPVLRNGRADKGMPAFNLSDAESTALVAFIHDAKAAAESAAGGRRTVLATDLQTGDADAGKEYFANACARCHSATGDLAGIAVHRQGLALLQRMLYPVAGRGGAAPAPPRVSVTLANGQTMSGTLAYRDEFTITLTDTAGWSRSWPVGQVQIAINDPLQAHAAQLGKYTDDDMHNVLAYLRTLK